MAYTNASAAPTSAAQAAVKTAKSVKCGKAKKIAAF